MLSLVNLVCIDQVYSEKKVGKVIFYANAKIAVNIFSLDVKRRRDGDVPSRL